MSNEPCAMGDELPCYGPVAGRCRLSWQNCDFSRATFKSSSPCSRRNNSLEPPRQGPIDTHCQPSKYVLTSGSLLASVAHLATVISNGLDWRQRWFPALSRLPIVRPLQVAHSRPAIACNTGDMQLGRQILNDSHGPTLTGLSIGSPVVRARRGRLLRIFSSENDYYYTTGRAC